MTENQSYRLTLTSIHTESHWNDSDADRPSCNIISYESPYIEQGPAKQVLSNNRSAFEYINRYFAPFASIKNSFTETGLMPAGVKAIGANYVVFEKPPCFKNIFFIPTQRSDITDESIAQVYRIPIPWQLYVIKFNPDMYVYEVRMYFMKNSLTSVHEELFLPPLPNFYTSGMLCPPIMDNMEDVDRYSKNHAGIMQCGYDWVWNSGSNHDLTEACLHPSLQIEEQQNSILKYVPEPEYNAYFKYKKNFNRSYSRYSASATQISRLFTAWEKSSLTEVCELFWPNISGIRPNFNYDEDPSVREENGYYDHLYDFISNQDGGPESDEEIQYMIENGDYDTEGYHDYLRRNDLIPASSTMPWGHVYTYFQTMTEIISSINQELGFSSTSLQYDINLANLLNLNPVCLNSV